MTDSAFCWVNRVGMPHDVWLRDGKVSCRRCGKKYGSVFEFDREAKRNARECQDAPKPAVLPENEGQNA